MLKRIFGRRSKSAKLAPPSPFAKLRLETLEARDVPAVTVVSMGDVTEGGADGAFAFHRAGSTASELTIQFTVSGSATTTPAPRTTTR